MAKKDSPAGDDRESLLVDRIIDAINTIQERQGVDGSGRYINRLEQCARGLEKLVRGLPSDEEVKASKKRAKEAAQAAAQG